MASYRKQLRAAARDAITADARLGAYTSLLPFARNIDGAGLPCIAVMIPSERQDLIAQDEREVEVLLQVLIRQEAGADIEDVVDADVEALDAAIIAPLQAVSGVHYVSPGAIDFTAATSGERLTEQALVSYRIGLTTEVPR